MKQCLSTLDDIKNGPLTIGLLEAAGIIGISRTTAYALVKRDEFPAKFIRIGSQVRVITASLVELLEG